MIALAPPFPAARRLTQSVYLLVLLSVAAFSEFESSSLPVVLTLAAAILSWLFVESPSGKPLPKYLINLGLLAAAVYLWREISDPDLRGQNLIVALGHFILALMLCKLFEKKGVRDLTQILVLSLLIVVASTMFSYTMLYAAILCCYLAVLVYVILLFNLSQQSIIAAEELNLPRVLLPEGGMARFSRDARRVAIRCAMLLMPLAAVLFLMLPRTRGANFLTSWSGPTAVSQTGYSDIVQFRDYGQLNQSDAIVMEVRLTQNGQNIGSEYLEPYFRGQTLDSYDEEYRKWFRSFDPTTEAFVSQYSQEEGPAQIISDDEVNGRSLIFQEYNLRIPSDRLLFALAPPVSVSVRNISSFKVDHRDLKIMVENTSAPLQYTVSSLPMLQPDAFASYPVPHAQVPRAVDQLAHQLARDLLPPADQKLDTDGARRVVAFFESYLRDNYPYSLKFRQVDRSLDPTADFLLNRKTTGGHCEYFASAMVMLCRSVGIQARMVTGYHGGEYNSLSGYYTVRQRDAHAWAEVLLPGVGWVQSDPSPRLTNVDYSDSVVRRWLQDFSRLVQNVWLGSIVSFDNESRRLIAAWVSQAGASIRGVFSDLWAGILYAFNAPSADMWMRLSLFGPALGLFFMGLWLTREWRRSQARYRSGRRYRRHAKLSADVLFLDELFRLIESHQLRDGDKLKLIRESQHTPAEFIEQAAPTLGLGLMDARWLIRTFYALRFGPFKSSLELKHEIAAALQRVRRALDSQAAMQPASQP